MNNKRIFLCEDDEGIIDVITVVLEEKGYTVEVFDHTNTIFSQIKQSNPHLILMDLWMPEINGDELTRKLKAEQKTKHIPIIILSANRDTTKIAEDAGADAHLLKPFNIDELETIVEKHIL